MVRRTNETGAIQHQRKHTPVVLPYDQLDNQCSHDVFDLRE